MKQRNNFPVLRALTLSTCLISFTACNEFVASSYRDGSALEGATEYSGQFTPVNSLGEISGQVRLRLSGTELMAQAELKAPVKDTTHPMFLMSMDECPTVEEYDENGDGFVDAEEARRAYGEVLLPMDDDLGDLEAGSFPMTDENGSFTYSQSVSLSELSGVLGQERPDLEGKVVVVTGVPAETELPDTVASPQDGDAQSSLPVACAKLGLDHEGETPSKGDDVETQTQRQLQHQRRQGTQQQVPSASEAPGHEMPEMDESMP